MPFGFLWDVLSTKKHKARVDELQYMLNEKGKRVVMAGAKQLLVSSLMLFIQLVVFLISAGHFPDFRPWVYFGTAFVHYCVSIAVQCKLNPELVVQRLKRKREGSKLWDEVLMRLSNLMVVVAIPAVAGLDYGRFHWFDLDVSFVVLGFLFVFASTFFLNWAMVVNPYFEPTVRIQKDRGHRVIASGPYAIVRHPGYLAGILFTLSIPVLIGSVLAFIPVGIYLVLIVARTWLEDETLRKELDGYSKYAELTRYRLLPGVW